MGFQSEFQIAKVWGRKCDKFIATATGHEWFLQFDFEVYFACILNE